LEDLEDEDREMKCAYHPTNIASARCGSCERSLCPACDHRIKGYPYCQDCIVAGIEALRRKGCRNQGVKMRAEESSPKSPLIAVMLSWIPGLGAAYNGQNIRALVHFVVIVGLWIISDIFRSPFQMAFILAGTGFYFFSIYHAYASAQRQRAGVDLQEEEDWLKQFLREHTGLWGGLLVSVGMLAIINVVFPDYLHYLWPLLLVAAGFYFILRGYQRGLKEFRERADYRTSPPSVIGSSYDRSRSDFAQAESRCDR
jgi:hypothetical protein